MITLHYSRDETFQNMYSYVYFQSEMVNNGGEEHESIHC